MNETLGDVDIDENVGDDIMDGFRKKKGKGAAAKAPKARKVGGVPT